LGAAPRTPAGLPLGTRAGGENKPLLGAGERRIAVAETCRRQPKRASARRDGIAKFGRALHRRVSVQHAMAAIVSARKRGLMQRVAIDMTTGAALARAPPGRAGVELGKVYSPSRRAVD